jgi:hypothetical protein
VGNQRQSEKDDECSVGHLCPLPRNDTNVETFKRTLRSTSIHYRSVLCSNEGLADRPGHSCQIPQPQSLLQGESNNHYCFTQPRT